jgi:catechol 2,3-dioxygenase-like lactoylglutathione lyase family enzyme
MPLHGLAQAVVGVPDVDASSAFYEEFGLTQVSPGCFATLEGGEQLQLVQRRVRGLVEVAIAADDDDDLERVRRAAGANDAFAEDDNGDVVVTEPVLGFRARVTVRPRIDHSLTDALPVNRPGVVARGSERSTAIFPPEAVKPRRLGHLLYATPDIEASSAFFQDVLGFQLSDRVPGLIEFVRCSTDHHNIGLVSSPVPFLHHTSWQVDDVDQIGHGAMRLLATDPTCNVWGLGRHFLGSNYFWYLREPAGNYVEYFADLDQIAEDAEWLAQSWEPEKALFAWGPPVPPEFLEPVDIDELSRAYATSVEA